MWIRIHKQSLSGKSILSMWRCVQATHTLFFFFREGIFDVESNEIVNEDCSRSVPRTACTTPSRAGSDEYQPSWCSALHR